MSLIRTAATSHGWPRAVRSACDQFPSPAVRGKDQSCTTPSEPSENRALDSKIRCSNPRSHSGHAARAQTCDTIDRMPPRSTDLFAARRCRAGAKQLDMSQVRATVTMKARNVAMSSVGGFSHRMFSSPQPPCIGAGREGGTSTVRGRTLGWLHEKIARQQRILVF